MPIRSDSNDTSSHKNVWVEGEVVGSIPIGVPNLPIIIKSNKNPWMLYHRSFLLFSPLKFNTSCLHSVQMVFIFLIFWVCFLADVTEPLLIEVDQIYHLACPASPIFYKYNPVKVCISIFISFWTQVAIMFTVSFLPFLWDVLIFSHFSMSINFDVNVTYIGHRVGIWLVSFWYLTDNKNKCDWYIEYAGTCKASGSKVRD